MAHTLKESDLAQFWRTENWYKHPLSHSILYTDGVQYVSEHGGAYWLLDEIVLSQSIAKVRSEPFQAWKLTVVNKNGLLVCEDGNYNIVFSKVIPYTDFPLPEIQMWLENNVMMLPVER